VRRLPIERIPTLPAPVRGVIRHTVWRFGAATSSFRRLPDFLILGAQKAGTTALYAYLRWHPQVSGPTWKEVSFFDRHWARGADWYRGQFPLRRRSGLVAVGEASPSYLFHPLAPERVAAVVPDARLIVLLREPGERAYSHYQHEVALGRESLSFEEALAAEKERTSGEVERMLVNPRYFSNAWWDHTYTARGLYAEQLERWFAVFPRDQLLVLTTDELADQTGATVERVVEFIGVPAGTDTATFPRVFERSYAPMSPNARATLQETFAVPNERLRALLSRDLPW
jgi:hypothetical protein